jgi:hypothetical protein
MLKYHLKKRIDIIVEAPMMRTITEKLDRARVPGYSVLPIIEGRGIDNSWNCSPSAPLRQIEGLHGGRISGSS